MTEGRKRDQIQERELGRDKNRIKPIKQGNAREENGQKGKKEKTNLEKRIK